MHNWYTTFDTRFGISVKNRITWVIYIFDLSLMKKKDLKKTHLAKDLAITVA
jgi:hypothetical protein